MPVAPSRASGQDADPRRLLVVSSIRWGFLWQRHQALAVAAAEDGWQVDFLQPRPRNIRQLATFPLRALRRTVVTQSHGPVPAGVSVLGPRGWLTPRRQPPYDLALVYLPDRLTEWFLARNGTRHVIYDAVLDWSTVPSTWYPPTGWRGAEQRIAGRDRTVVTTDADGMAQKLESRGIRCAVVPPAADPAFIDSGARRPGQDSRQRAALYFGSIRQEVDRDALVALATSGVTVDVVGPVDRPEIADELTAGGVRLHPALPLPEIAELAAAYRVVLLPYRGERAATLMPAKFWNCVATGGWVVTLGLRTPTLPTVVATRTTAEFVAAVRTALDAPVTGDRVPPPTWHSRWQTMLTLANARSHDPAGRPTRQAASDVSR